MSESEETRARWKDGWAIALEGSVIGPSMAWTKAVTIGRFLERMKHKAYDERAWNRLKKQGYSCVKVRVVKIE